METKKIIELVKSKQLGEYYALRNANTSKAFKNPMKSCYLLELNKNDIVVDIGGYVGEYSIFAAKYAKKVYTYEASPETFEVLTMNKKKNMRIFNKAVVGNNVSSIELYLSKGIGATNSVVKKHNKKTSVIVPAINFNKAIKKATVIKIDVEGAEYDYDFDYALGFVRGIILEFHPTSKNWISKANNIMKKIEKAGFKALLKPTFTNGWDTNSSFVRYE